MDEQFNQEWLCVAERCVCTGSGRGVQPDVDGEQRTATDGELRYCVGQYRQGQDISLHHSGWWILGVVGVFYSFGEWYPGVGGEQ